MKSGIVKATIIAATFGSLISGATTAMAEDISKETEVKFKATKGTPSYELNVKDIDGTTYGGQSVHYISGIDGYGVEWAVPGFVEVKGKFASDNEFVDVSVERTDDFGEDKIPELLISPYGLKSKYETIGKDKVTLFDGVSGKSFKTPEKIEGNSNVDYVRVIGKFDPYNFKEGTYTAQLKWTLTPHL